MNVSEAAKDILAHNEQWCDVPWPLMPEDIVASAEWYARSGEAPKLRAMTPADRRAIATRRAELKARGLMA